MYVCMYVKTSVHACGCHNTEMSKFCISVPGGLLLIYSAMLLAASLHCAVLLRCGKVTFNDESKERGGGGDKVFLVHSAKSYRGSRGRVRLYLVPTLRKRGTRLPVPCMLSWHAQMKTLLLYQTTWGHKQNSVSKKTVYSSLKRTPGWKTKKCSWSFINKTEIAKFQSLWDVTWCGLLCMYHGFRSFSCLRFQGSPEDKGSKILRNVGIYIPVQTVSYPKRL